MGDFGPPNAEQVARRLLILRSVYNAGYLIPPPDVLAKIRAAQSAGEYKKILAEIQKKLDELWSPLRERHYRDELSPDEKKFMSARVDQITERQLTDAFWRIESTQALMWCLGQIDSIPPYDTRADDEILKREAFRDYAKVVRESRLRPGLETETARSEAELWHWRSRTRELIERGTYPPNHPMFKDTPYDSLDGIVRLVAQKVSEEVPPKPTLDEDMVAKGKAYRDLTNDEWCDVRSITIERHLALNWVCGFSKDNRWELTPTGT